MFQLDQYADRLQAAADNTDDGFPLHSWHRSDLKSLMDFGRLQQVCEQYKSCRELMFQRPEAGEHRPEATAAAPPMLFPSGYSTQLQALVGERERRLQLALLPQVPTARQARRRTRSQSDLITPSAGEI